MNFYPIGQLKGLFAIAQELASDVLRQQELRSSMSICDCFGDSLMAPTLSSVDSESHLAQLKHFLIISFTHLYNNVYILFFTHSFTHSANICSFKR